jgi:hypothetical protein
LPADCLSDAPSTAAGAALSDGLEGIQQKKEGTNVEEDSQGRLLIMIIRSDQSHLVMTCLASMASAQLYLDWTK